MAAMVESNENASEKTSQDVSEIAKEENGVKLEDLKVAELKNELEKRDLDKTGVKYVLVERLKAALLKEGENPDECCFDLSTTDSPSKSQNKRTKSELEIGETQHINGEKTDENPGINEDDVSLEEKQEIALQLSIDEEEAQLNEENLIEASKENKQDVECELPKKDATVEEKSTESILAKPRVTTTETKERKVIKAVSKTSDVPSTVSQKVLKVIGKNEKLKNPTVLAKSLWITGLQTTTRAADLTTLFSKQGRVLSVKIVKSAKQNPSKCYGFVTMATNKDATKAIQNLHNTKLNEQIISVEKAQSEPSTLLKKSESKISVKKQLKKEVALSKAPASEVKGSTKAEGKLVENDKQVTDKSEEKKGEKTRSREKSKSKDSEKKSRDLKEKDRYDHRPTRRPVGLKPRPFPFSDRSRYGNYRKPFGARPFSSRLGFTSGFRNQSNMNNLQRFREQRYETEKYHERERSEAERRRADEISRHRYIERKHREEAYRLEREKERLRIERELLERERAELLKLEREKQRLERERLEREREELRRQAELKKSIKRSFSRIEREPELWDERKKSRFVSRPNFHRESSQNSGFDFSPRDRSSFSRELNRHSNRFNTPKPLDALPRAEFSNRNARREVSIRSREDRQVFARNDFRERDARRSFSSKERERHSSRRDPSREEWKQNRRVHERIISPSSTEHRRMTYY